MWPCGSVHLYHTSKQATMKFCKVMSSQRCCSIYYCVLLRIIDHRVEWRKNNSESSKASWHFHDSHPTAAKSAHCYVFHSFVYLFCCPLCLCVCVCVCILCVHLWLYWELRATCNCVLFIFLFHFIYYYYVWLLCIRLPLSSVTATTQINVPIQEYTCIGQL